MTNPRVLVEYDPRKAAANLRKHESENRLRLIGARVVTAAEKRQYEQI